MTLKLKSIRQLLLEGLINIRYEDAQFGCKNSIDIRIFDTLGKTFEAEKIGTTYLCNSFHYPESFISIASNNQLDCPFCGSNKNLMYTGNSVLCKDCSILVNREVWQWRNGVKQDYSKMNAITYIRLKTLEELVKYRRIDISGHDGFKIVYDMIPAFGKEFEPYSQEIRTEDIKGYPAWVRKSGYGYIYSSAWFEIQR
jgi:hypothetical protein